MSLRHLHGDLLALGAGVLYTGYLIAVQKVRDTLAPLPLLFLASLVGAAMLLPLTLALGEQIIPDNWTFVVLLALSSQVIGQGLLVYALGKLSPIVIGLTLLTQPAVSALVGWLAYGERFSTARLDRHRGDDRRPDPRSPARAGLAFARARDQLSAMAGPTPLEKSARSPGAGGRRECGIRRLDGEGGRVRSRAARNRSGAGQAGDAEACGRTGRGLYPRGRPSARGLGGGAGIERMKIRERIRALVWQRLEIMAPAREAVRTGLVDPGHAAKPAAGDAAVVGSADHNVAAGRATPAPTSIIIPSA